MRGLSPSDAGLDAGRGARVVVERVSKRYETGETVINALDDVTLSIEAGTLLSLTGPSGSGKSTLLHLVGAMDSADSGRIAVGEYEVTKLTRREQVRYRRRIGFVFQRFHLLPALTALDNVAAPLMPYSVAFDKKKRSEELLAAVGLAGREESLPSELSGGQQQRVAIARALVNDPILLLADEPTGNLDSQTGGEILQLILDLRQRSQMTVIVATHDALIASACERVVRLHDGTILDDVSVAHDSDNADVLDRIGRPEPGGA